MLVQRWKFATGTNREISSGSKGCLEDQVRRINGDYGFNLSDEETSAIACRAEEFEKMFRCLYESRSQR